MQEKAMSCQLVVTAMPENAGINNKVLSKLLMLYSIEIR